MNKSFYFLMMEAYCTARFLVLILLLFVDSVCVIDQMGSSFKSAVFADDVADHLRGWADGARRRMRRSATAGDAAGCLGAERRRLEGRSRPDQLRSISF